MRSLINSDFKLGVLGGGQLGKMMAQVAQKWSLPLWVLDTDPAFPAGTIAHHFEPGSFKSEADVLRFGRQVDVLTIEIEHVHIGALEQLQAEGKIIHPNPQSLTIIKDKGLQKAFYQDKGLPTSDFQLFESGAALKAALEKGQVQYPFVQKTRTAGYDGKGVAVIRSAADLDKILPPACLIEPLVDIQKELAVIVARNPSGAIKAYPPVEMVFHPEANLVEFLLCPARISAAIAEKAEAIAVAAIEAFDICGLLAVELFLDTNDQILINEVAPRPHNSGHHTI
ncbi:MAG: ATP-grasp domain-containing protein, partial [Phaeodactylibacter sp.]|nr:ATP-grasp domain-containing protein [Phaeodactylibacter sp.]